jgi:8-amino-7-oxononanoate synthase
LIFCASIPPANAAVALAVLQVMREEPERVQRLNQIAERMREGYRQLGFDIDNSQTPVIPIVIGDDERTLLTWRLLFQLAGSCCVPAIWRLTPINRWSASWILSNKLASKWG